MRKTLREPVWIFNVLRRQGNCGWKVLFGLLVGITLVVIVAALLAQQWPRTRFQVLMDEGNVALSKGLLDASDGSGARQKFQAALALDGDRSEPREGLMRTGMTALRLAREAVVKNDAVDARKQLELAVALQVPKFDSDAVELELRQKEANGVGIEAALARARQAREAGHDSGDESAALLLYQQVLSLQPENTEALEAREDMLSAVLSRAREALQLGDLEWPTRAMAQVRRFDPGHADLPQVQAEWERRLDALRSEGDSQITAGNLADAARIYLQVLHYRSGDAAARSALQQLAEAHASRARSAASDFQFSEAERELAQAKAIAPDSATVRRLESALLQSRHSMASVGHASGSANRQPLRVASLLKQMRESVERGQWIQPPGESAYDRLREAQAIAPEDPAVRLAAQKIVPQVQRCFESELSANRIIRARECLDAWIALAPGDASFREAQQRLAARWIAVGAERLGMGDIDFAVRAVSEARALDPSVAGLADFAARVRYAQSTQ